jgi:hypothetical protein
MRIRLLRLRIGLLRLFKITTFSQALTRTCQCDFSGFRYYI